MCLNSYKKVFNKNKTNCSIKVFIIRIETSVNGIKSWYFLEKKSFFDIFFRILK